MKILQIASGNFFSTYGGGQVYVKNIVDEMIRRGMDVCVISFMAQSAGVVKKEYKGHLLYEIGNECDDKIISTIIDINPDIIHAHSHKSLVCRIGRQIDVPVIVTAHHGGIVCPAGTLLDCDDSICHKSVDLGNCLRCCLRNIRTGEYWYPWVRHLSLETYLHLGHFLEGKPFIPVITPVGGIAMAIEEKKRQWSEIIEMCSLMIAPSQAMGEALTTRGLNRKKLKVVPHGVPMPAHGDLLAIKDGPIRFFYVGRICYVKGIHVLLEAFHKLKQTDVELHLIGGAGNKQEEKYMNTLYKKYFCDNRIVWHGKVPPNEIYDKIKAFHISVSSSSFLEAFGLNIAESLAMGRPVVATRCGGAEMQIKDGINGWLVPTNDVEVLRAKLDEIVCKRDCISFISGNCRNSVITIEEHCATLLNIYEEYGRTKKNTD